VSQPGISFPFTISDRFDVAAEIGRGGFANVYAAFDRELGRDVAIKVLREEAVSSSAQKRFSLEMRVTARLEHPNILHVYDTGVWNERLYYVMELVRGPSLATRLATEGALPVVDSLSIARDVCAALAFAHDSGVVHRDVKPDNILLSDRGALLGDFGVAHLLGGGDPQGPITSTGVAVGTTRYMSPEQLFAEPKVDGRTDQYSLALVCYEMLTGVQPHVASSVEALRALRLEGHVTPVTIHRPMAPAAIDAAIARALSPAPADRFRDLHELMDALDAAAVESSAMPGRGRTSVSRNSRRWPSSLAGGTPAGLAERIVLSNVVARPSWKYDDSSGPRAPDVSAPRPSPMRRRRGLIALGLAAAASLAVGIAGYVRYRLAAADASVSTVAQLSVAIARRAAAGDSPFVDRVRTELDEWHEVTAAPPLVLTASLSDLTAEQLRTASDRAHATIIIQPSISTGDSTRWTLSVFDGRTARLRRLTRVTARGVAIGTADLRALAIQSLIGPLADSAPGIDGLPTPNLSAARAYAMGWRRVRSGPLDSARSSFAAAATLVPNFAAANWWSAQVGAWLSGRNASTWSDAARRAVASNSALHGTDSLLAAALVALSTDPPAACAMYRSALTRAPDSFVALYGLAQCQDLDSIVVRDPNTRSPRFRSSHWSALAAYDRAMDRLPGTGVAPIFARAVYITYASGNATRSGKGLPPDTTKYLALPSLRDDSIELLPLPRARISQGGATPESFSAALTRGRSALLALTAHWVARTPDSPDAWYNRANALELTGTYDAPDDLNSATRSLRRASELPADGILGARIDVARVRVAVRQGDFPEATRLARETVARGTPSSAVAAIRAPLAAFLLDAAAASRLLSVAASSTDERVRYRLPSWVVNSLPRSLADSLRAFGIGAILGECTGLAARRAQLERDLSLHVAAAELAKQREELLHEIYREAVPCLGASALRGFPPGSPVEEAVAALDARDVTKARSVMTELDAARQGMSASTLTADAVLSESWVWSQIGDAARASRIRRASMSNLASLSPFTFDQLSQAAALSRLKALTSKR
jgi:serine/threonine-protein kinase